MGIAVTLELLCSLHSITSGSIEIGLDGEAAYQQVFADQDPQVDQKAYDMLLAIRRKFRARPLTITGRHIKGHQDNDIPRHKLDRWANLNIDMDTDAKAILSTIRAGPPCPTSLSLENLQWLHSVASNSHPSTSRICIKRFLLIEYAISGPKKVSLPD